MDARFGDVSFAREGARARTVVTLRFAARAHRAATRASRPRARDAPKTRATLAALAIASSESPRPRARRDLLKRYYGRVGAREPHSRSTRHWRQKRRRPEWRSGAFYVFHPSLGFNT
jgi:hypothetical protein